MSVSIAGLWELGWNTPIKEIDLWQYPLRDFGVDQLYLTPITGIANKFVQERDSLETILQEHQGYTKVYCDERGNTDLPAFTHPKKALYIFGKANFNPLLTYMSDDDLSLKIPTTANKGLLWPHQAATVILYDRFIKSTN